MRERGTRRGALLILVLLGAACGHPEQNVVDQYFMALNSKDNQTLGSFAVVSLDTKDKKVDSWTIAAGGEEVREPAPLVALVKKQKDVEAETAAQTKTWSAYKLEHYPELEKVRDVLKAGGKMPANLAPVAAEYEQFNQKDRELKKALAESKDATEKEKRIVAMSVGTTEDLEGLTGELITKHIDLALKMGGESQNYAMTLKKYVMTRGAGGPKMMSRWVVYDLKPKS